jgi:uncharacterized protein DUF3307
MNAFELFATLLVWHALADYPLQGDFLAKAKNRAMPIPGVPWWQALSAHALIHAGGVAFLTGSLPLGIVELIAHAAIDDSKCAGKISYNMDQLLHVVCKAVYVLAVLAGGAQ